MKHDPHDAVDYIIKHARQFADAKAQRVYLEELSKSKKSMGLAKAYLKGGGYVVMFVASLMLFHIVADVYHHMKKKLLGPSSPTNGA